MADVELKGEIKGISIKEEMNKQRTVRISTEAHALLAEKAVDFNASMKEIASEAIVMLVKKEDRDKELHAHMITLREETDRLRKVFALYLLISGGAGIVIGFIIGAVL